MSTDAYQVHNWVSKEVIKKEQLNHIEEGIYKNNVGVRDLETNKDNILANFAPVEETDTASSNYQTDEVLVFVDRLCKATTDITSGDTLEVGVNLAYTTLAELLG